MIIGRMREHVARQNWFAVLIDLAIVIIGVFIGLQVSNWNAARIERAEVRAYRAQIIENLKANEREIAASGRYHRQVLGHAVAALEGLEGKSPRDETFLVHAFQASQYWPLRMERSAYDEMIASGMAKNFGNVAIRRRLSAYYAASRQFEATALSQTAYRERVRRALLFSVQRRLRERCHDVLQTSFDGSQQAALPEGCTLQLPPALVTQAAMRLSKTSELDQDLTLRIGDLEQKISLFDRWLRRTREMRVYLQRMED